MSKVIGIDLGTANTIVYLENEGIVTREPSVVAKNTITEEIIPKEELSATVANLDNQVKSVTRLSGEHESWKYGEICSLENQSIHEKVAVKLNGEYHLAFLRS